MNNKVRLFRFILLLFIFTFTTSSVYGQGGGSVTVGPAGAIPVLSGTTLVLLSLLMIIAAFRVFRADGGAMNRLAGVLVLAGGVLLGGYNIKYSLASAAVVVVGGACNMESIFPYDDTLLNETLDNNCPNDVLITEITNSCPPFDVVDGTCMENGIVVAAGSCTLPMCDADSDN